jgi:putative component of toxin-antitoxin plasmid stabilization module
MLEVVESATYKNWFADLRDLHVRARIDARIRRLALGNPPSTGT